MNLRELAELVGTNQKWILNAKASLGLRGTYTLAIAMRLAVARAIGDALEIPLTRAVSIADAVLSRWRGDSGMIDVPLFDDALVMIAVDIARVQSTINIRRSALATTLAPRMAGRPRTASRDAIAAAEAWGIDLSLLRHNRQRSAESRLRELDGMMAFSLGVRRVAEPGR